MLLFDAGTASKNHTALLTKVFDCPSSAKYWLDYTNYICQKCSPNKAQTIQLLDRALDMIDEEENKDNRNFCELKLLYISARVDHSESLDYFENVLWKREIGLRFAKVLNILHLSFMIISFAT